MAFNSPRKLQHQYSPPRTSPLRHGSTASTNSSAYSAVSGKSFPSRTSTLTSSASSNYYDTKVGHKRGLSEVGGPSDRSKSIATDTYKSARQSLRPLPQPPASALDPFISVDSASDEMRKEPRARTTFTTSHGPLPPLSPTAPHVDGRHTSVREDSQDIESYQKDGLFESEHHAHQTTFTAPDLEGMKYSSTKQLRTLSKFTREVKDESFSIASSGPSVVGLHGRRQLKRTDSARIPGKGGRGGAGGFEGRNWMDQQRQFLQAYEYLCHIGEAKEWIEDVIHKPIPPIIQLEEALRDGVTLAETVQTFNPQKQIRIFHNPKLQFRHSDNIAAFFRFLAEVELPELFRFELIDLYEKKNIPKVIYCIHALSWLLYKKGMVDFRIGNLVGQLEFEHHELEEMQKGLDKAGVSMPSFSGMSATFGAEPEPEPIETEDERIERELGEHEHGTIDLQAQIRGCLLRLRLGQTMQGLWDAEELLIDLQSRIRGDWARQITDYRVGMKIFATNLQSATRGFVARKRLQSLLYNCESHESDPTALQSIIRAYKSRQAVKALRNAAVNEVKSTSLLQATIRGFLQRSAARFQHQEALSLTREIDSFQALARGAISRLHHKETLLDLDRNSKLIVRLQAAIRAGSTRRGQKSLHRDLTSYEDVFCLLQAHLRGMIQRRGQVNFFHTLKKFEPEIVQLQASVRALQMRTQCREIQSSLVQSQDQIVQLQAACRAFNLRKLQQSNLDALRSTEHSLTDLQACSRAMLYRSYQSNLLAKLQSEAPSLIQLQSLARALLLRSDIGYALSQLDDEDEVIESLQAHIRAMIVRHRFAEKKRFFDQNMEKVIKVQSFVRARQQGQAYKSLTSGKNPPVGTVKNFVHLLNDSDFDFDEEVEFERLRKTVVQQVRQNEMADQYITQLDIKIALLVKNKITLDEVVKHQKHFGGSVGSLLTNRELSSKDPFDLKALNKNSRLKLEHYQQLFFILQTQPQYLARLFSRIREQATPEKDCERIKHLVMGLFGYAQKRREEYYLVKLIARSIKEEVSSSRSLGDYLRGNHFWSKVFTAYTKSPKDRKFLRDTLGPIVTENVLDNPDCDLESDPMAIYLKAIENEQNNTGMRSQRRPDIPREAAIRDPETKNLFIAHLQDLREIVDQIFTVLEDLLHRLPYGIRYISMQMYQYLTTKFHTEEPDHILLLVGNWIWKSYLQPALLEPDKFGVVDRGVSGDQKRNLAEIAKVLGQIASAQPFGQENIFLNPLNSYVSESIGRIVQIWRALIDVPDAEQQFDIDEFNDLYAKTKPTLYIKMTDIFAIHQIVATDIAYLSSARDDMLKEVIRELGNAKSNESELMSVSSSTEICLTLNPKLHDMEDPEADVKALFMETKRCVLYIIRVQSGSNLMDIMVKPISQEEEARWGILVQEELSATSRKRGAYSEAHTVIDIATLSYSELKRTALENILRLEQRGRLSRHNHYQDILNAIAVDIRTKHRRRVQRARELEGVRLTLDRLNGQASYLDQQLKTYNDYIEQAMVTLQNKKGKKRFIMPFTKQWDHERELQRSGRTPKFGSYKYSAQELANRGILVSWNGYSERQWNQLDLTISSNEVGVFSIEGSSGSIAMPGASAEVPLDDLLQAQYNGTQSMEFFGSEKVRVNVNLFLHLIMRKFYKDRDG